MTSDDPDRPAPTPSASVADTAPVAPVPATPTPAPPPPASDNEVSAAVVALGASADAAVVEVQRVVYGQVLPIKLMLTCLLSRGHALLEGVPGTAKTLLARSLARTVDARFQRIQFTPDLMPSDVLGTHIFDPRTQSFVLHEGPVFTDVLLADEINRTPPKTQAALLEVMEERAVTVDGDRRIVSPVFTVFATQNPLEFEGTYPLPEAQLDRFMMKIEVPYPDDESEAAVLRRYGRGGSAHTEADELVQSVLTTEELHGLLAVVGSVHIEDSVLHYVQRLLRASRDSDVLVLGAGTRAGIHLLVASRAWAALSGRDFVTPDDIKTLATPVFAHRLLLQADAQVDGLTTADVVADLLRRVEVPR